MKNQPTHAERDRTEYHFARELDRVSTELTEAERKHDAFIEELCELIPEEYDADEAAESIIVRCIKDLTAVRNALFVEPCHVTGMHSPDHHLTHDTPCGFQSAVVLNRILTTLGTSLEALPRRLHDKCVWCHEGARAEQHAAWVASWPGW